MHTATFFITTARSGTQWVCETLRSGYPDLLAVEHEPIRYAYAPKRCLRDPFAAAALRKQPTVRRHLDRVHEMLRRKSYVEVGFPAFAAAPILWEEFGSRLRLVQLVRHPVRVAASIVTHRWFDPGHRTDIEDNIALAPTDSGVRMRHYAGQWTHMSAFEKALFNWAEVHLYGLEIRDELSAVPHLQVSLEELLARSDARRRLTEFLGIPFRPVWSDAPQNIIDQYRKKTVHKIDRSKVHTLPEVAQLAERFGYDLDSITEPALQLRYCDSKVAQARRRIGHMLKRVAPVGIPVAALSGHAELVVDLLT